MEDSISKVFIEQDYSTECRSHPMIGRMSLTVLRQGPKSSREDPDHVRSEEKEQCSLELTAVFLVTTNGCRETTQVFCECLI